MAVDVPTTDQFLERFPNFEGQEDLIDVLIIEASRQIDEQWTVADQKAAIMYLVAHMIVMEGSADSLPVTSESLAGALSISYAVDMNADALTRTEYGRRFLQMRRRSLGGASIVVA